MNEMDATQSFPAWAPEADQKAEHATDTAPELMIITGMSGAGRTRAGDVLEDLGWYVVDNLPPKLLGSLVGLISPDGKASRFAAIVDVRSREFFAELVLVLEQLESTGIKHTMMFLDCADDVLVQRYESVRRPHPLQDGGRLLDAVHEERKLLDQVRSRADMIIDTSTLSVHDLARHVRSLVAEEGETLTRVTVMSFGFKYGVPVDADHMVDVRFLANPYWIGELRHLTGHDEAVRDYVLSRPGATEFITKYAELIESILAGYQHELKPRVTIAVGCTGGRHRSVAMAETLAGIFREHGVKTTTSHRDVGRD